MSNIRYKMIRIESRTSCYITGDYRLTYVRGKTVTAPKHSLGVFVFNNLRNAQRFAKRSGCFEVIKVKAIGEGKKHKWGISDCELNDMKKKTFHHYLSRLKSILATKKDERELEHGLELPTGTVCYPAVKVLE